MFCKFRVDIPKGYWNFGRKTKVKPAVVIPRNYSSEKNTYEAHSTSYINLGPVG